MIFGLGFVLDFYDCGINKMISFLDDHVWARISSRGQNYQNKQEIIIIFLF
jgi:hypothetical protein